MGSKFVAQETLTVAGKNCQSFYAAQDTVQTNKSVESSSSMFGGAISTGNNSSTDTSAKSVAIASELTSTQAINVQVGNSATFEGANLTAQQIAFVNLDPKGNGNLILNGSTNTTQTSHTEKSETLGVYQEAKGQGSTIQTLNQTTLKGNVSFDAGLKITAQVPKEVQATAGGQALAKQVQTLNGTLGSSSSGLEYLNQLAANPNVKWDKIALANDKWSYEQAGLTPAGAALLSIAVAAYTGGMGAEMLGGTAATTTSAATLMGSTTLATAVNAGFASLASQAAVAMVNNGGDIGKTLAQLGSEQSIKGLLTTMATAGALQSLDKALGFDGINAKSTFGDQLLKNVTNNIASRSVDAALNGRKFDENVLSSALTDALITSGMAYGANAIGNAASSQNGTPAQIDAFTQKLAHAVLGCAAGAAQNGGCGAGAVGAVVGEMAAEFYTSTNKSTMEVNAMKANALKFAQVMAAVAGVIAGGGGDNAAAVTTASTTGTNAAQNNYLTHAEDQMRQQADAACKKNPASESCAVKAQLDTLDGRRDAEIKPLIDACKDSGKAVNCEEVAKHYAKVNGFGFASNKYESLGKSGTPFSENGKLVPKNEKAGEEAHYIAPQIKQKDGTYKEDPGGMSYGPFQLSSKTGGLEDFMNYLTKNDSEEAKGFLSALNQVGGLGGAREGKVAFMDKFMELTQKDPQFVEYQFESINQGSNMKFVRKETRVAGLEFDGLPTESKEALFSTSVQHGGGGANKALDQALSRKLVDPAEDNFAIKQSQYNDAVKDGKALITQLDQLKDQKIKLLESTQGSSGEALNRLDQQIGSVNQKIEAKNAKVQANEAFIKTTQAAMQDAGFKASADPEEFIKDVYEWRIKSNPSEAKTRYIPERDMLLKQLKERLEQEKAAKSK